MVDRFFLQMVIGINSIFKVNGTFVFTCQRMISSAITVKSLYSYIACHSYVHDPDRQPFFLIYHCFNTL